MRESGPENNIMFEFSAGLKALKYRSDSHDNTQFAYRSYT
jgi:hypothetical protein